MGIYNTFVRGFILHMQWVYPSCMGDVGGSCLLNIRISYQIIVPRGTIRITDGSRKQHGRRCVGKRA